LAKFEVVWLDNCKFKNLAREIFWSSYLVSETVGIFLIGWKMAEEIDFENRHFWNFKSHVTLTLTSDNLESHIAVNVSSTLANTTIWFVAALSLIVDMLYMRSGASLGLHKTRGIKRENPPTGVTCRRVTYRPDPSVDWVPKKVTIHFQNGYISCICPEAPHG